MEELKTMKQMLIGCVQGQLGDLHNVDAKELGEAIDMIKDLSEAIYYCDISKAMEESKEEQKNMHYYTPPYYPPVMYYDDNVHGTMGNRGGNSRMYYEGERYPAKLQPHETNDYLMEKMDREYGRGRYPMEIRDYREGRSPMTRRMYMESKEMKHGEEKQKQELEKYMNELSQDIMEMINDSNPSDKAMLSQKLRTLADKIV